MSCDEKNFMGIIQISAGEFVLAPSIILVSGYGYFMSCRACTAYPSDTLFTFFFHI